MIAPLGIFLFFCLDKGFKHLYSEGYNFMSLHERGKEAYR